MNRAKLFENRLLLFFALPLFQELGRLRRTSLLNVSDVLTRVMAIGRSKQEKFSLFEQHDEAASHNEHRRNENCNSGFLFTSLRCCCFVHTLRIFYSNDDASFISVEV